MYDLPPGGRGVHALPPGIEVFVPEVLRLGSYTFTHLFVIRYIFIEGLVWASFWVVKRAIKSLLLKKLAYLQLFPEGLVTPTSLTGKQRLRKVTHSPHST